MVDARPRHEQISHGSLFLCRREGWWLVIDAQLGKPAFESNPPLRNRDAVESAQQAFADRGVDLMVGIAPTGNHLAILHHHDGGWFAARHRVIVSGLQSLARPADRGGLNALPRQCVCDSREYGQIQGKAYRQYLCQLKNCRHSIAPVAPDPKAVCHGP